MTSSLTFVLSDQDGDLVGRMTFQAKKNIYSPGNGSPLWKVTFHKQRWPFNRGEPL